MPEEQPKKIIEKDSQILFRRLLIAKGFYSRATEQHIIKSNPIDKMLSIHLLHNAVEIVLRATILHYEIRQERELNIDFESMMSEISSKCKTIEGENINFPFRQELRNLNLQRNLCQHHATEPENTALNESQVFVKRFLEKACERYFQINWNEISLVDLVYFDASKELLKEAQNLLESNSIEKALQKTVIAFEKLIQNYNSTKTTEFGQSPFSFGHNLPDPEHLTGEFDTSDFPLSRKLKSFLGDLRNSVNSIQKAMEIVSINIDYRKYIKFKLLTPDFVLMLSGEPDDYQFLEDHWGKRGIPNQEETEFCINFVIESAITLQNFDFNLKT